MSAKDDGGSAFPRSTPHGMTYSGESGMSLRDYFAAQAIQGLMCCSWDANGKTPENIFNTWVSSAYELADAMLEARKK